MIFIVLPSPHLRFHFICIKTRHNYPMAPITGVVFPLKASMEAGTHMMRVAGRAPLLVQAPMAACCLCGPSSHACSHSVHLRVCICALMKSVRSVVTREGRTQLPPPQVYRSFQQPCTEQNPWVSPQKGLPFSNPRLVAPSVWRAARHPCLRLRVLRGQPPLKAQA